MSSYRQLPKMAGNCRKWPEIAENSQKRLKKAICVHYFCIVLRYYIFILLQTEMAEPRLKTKADGSLLITKDPPETGTKGKARPAAVVRAEAENRCIQAAVPPTEKNILAFTSVEFGKYQGKTFKWLLENAVGWAVYFLARYSYRIILLKNIMLLIFKLMYFELIYAFLVMG